MGWTDGVLSENKKGRRLVSFCNAMELGVDITFKNLHKYTRVHEWLESEMEWKLEA